MAVFCNIRTCRISLKEKLWVTSCLHSFCEKHAQSLENLRKCPLCNTNLNKPFDIIRQNPTPPEGLKAMLLVGLHPEIVFEMVKSSMTFWSSQQEQEIYFHSKLLKNLQERARKSTDLEQTVAKLEEELNQIKRMCQGLENKVASSQQETRQLKIKIEEKNRQLQEMEMVERTKKRCLELYATGSKFCSSEDILEKPSINNKKFSLNSEEPIIGIHLQSNIGKKILTKDHQMA